MNNRWRPSSPSAGRYTISVIERDFYNYLPALAQMVANRHHDIDAVLRPLIASSAEVYPQTEWNPLDCNNLHNVFRAVFDLIEEASAVGTYRNISKALYEGLERYLSVDLQRNLSAYPRHVLTRKSQHLFRALADISYTTQSRHLGVVLHEFFTTNARCIAQHNNASAMIQWCFAILRSAMHPDAKFECLACVLRERPDFRDHTCLGSVSRTRTVMDALGQVAGGVTAVDLSSPSLGQGQIDWPVLRGRGAERSLTPVYFSKRRSSRGDARVIERQAKQMIQSGELQADEGRRMLRLTMERSHRDKPNVGCRDLCLLMSDSDDEDGWTEGVANVIRGRRRLLGGPAG